MRRARRSPRPGSTRSRDADAARDGLVGAREDSLADTREQRGAERGALLGLHPLEWQPEHRGDDLQPQLAACSAAGDASDFEESLPSSFRSSSESRRPNATPSSIARQSAPRSWRSDRPGERAARVRIRVRRALAGEVGREHQPFDAGLPARRLGLERAQIGCKSVCGARPPSRRRSTSRPSRARCPAPRGRRRARAPARRAGRRATRRRRRPTSRARPRRGRASRCRRRAQPPPGRLRRRSLSTRTQAGASRAGSRAPRRPPPTSGGWRRRRAASRTRPRRRSRARR